MTIRKILMLILLIGVLITTNTHSQREDTFDFAGILISVVGNVKLERVGWRNYYPVSFGTILGKNDAVRVERTSEATILCGNLRVVKLEDGDIKEPNAVCDLSSRLIICDDNGCRFRPLTVEDIEYYFHYSSWENVPQLPDSPFGGFDGNNLESSTEDVDCNKHLEVEVYTICQELKKLDISNVAKAFVLAFAYYERNLLDDAIIQLELIEDPQEAAVYYWLGVMYSRENRFDESIDQLNRAIDLYPKSNIEALADAHFELGAAYNQLGDLAEACSEWEIAQTLYETLNNTGIAERIGIERENECQ